MIDVDEHVVASHVDERSREGRRDAVEVRVRCRDGCAGDAHAHIVGVADGDMCGFQDIHRFLRGEALQALIGGKQVDELVLGLLRDIGLELDRALVACG